MIERIKLTYGTIAVCNICGDTSMDHSTRKRFEKEHAVRGSRSMGVRVGARVRIRIQRGPRTRWERFVIKRAYYAGSQTYLSFPPTPGTIRPALHELCVELQNLQWPKQKLNLTFEVFDVRRSKRPVLIHAGLGRRRR